MKPADKQCGACRGTGEVVARIEGEVGPDATVICHCRA